jgi:hypothetical protein
MTPKQKVIRALNGEKSDTVPAGLHGWGMYKFGFAGKLSDYSREKEMWKIHGEELARIEIDFQETFKPDFIQLAEAFFESKKEIINGPECAGMLSAVRKLESKKLIDEFLDRVYRSPDDLGKMGIFNHLRILSDRYGEEYFIMLTTEGPVHDLLDEDGILGFQHGMLQMMDNPALFVYLVEGMFRRQLMYVQAVKNYGAHGYTQSFSYLSTDLVSPEMYRKTLFPIQRDFYREVDRIGLFPILTSWGYVTPLVNYFKDTNIRGLMVEESRKNFTNDIGEIKRELGNTIGLFGNVSGENTLLYGTVGDVKDEVKEQIRKAGLNGGFLSSSGTPIAFGTPHENVKALIDTAKEYRING